MIVRFKETERSQGGAVDDKLPGIRCPRCRWRPRKSDRWQCKCHHVWNTFDTRGVCPACRFAWRDTQCLSCHVMSPHDDWYESTPPM